LRGRCTAAMAAGGPARSAASSCRGGRTSNRVPVRTAGLRFRGVFLGGVVAGAGADVCGARIGGGGGGLRGC